MKDLASLETTLNEYFGKKAPALPVNVKELVVKFAPWLTVIGVVLAIPALLALVGLGGMVAITAPLGGVTGMQQGFGYMVSVVFLIATVALEGLAIPGLFAKNKNGWKMIFYSVLVSTAGSLLSLNLISAIIGFAIGCYFLFQVKEYYK